MAEAVSAQRESLDRASQQRASARPMDPEQRRRVRRNVTVLVVVVLALYFGFILYSVLHGQRH